MPENPVTVGSDEWLGRTGDSWAAEWRRTDRSFTMLTERLLQRTREFEFEWALDVGCGAGELSLAIARGQPQCKVTGVDISPQLVATARDRAADHLNVTFEIADAASWRPNEKSTPDLIVSRHGVMFFANPVTAFGNLHALAAQRAGLLFSCFRAWDENPAFTEVARLLPTPVPPPDPDVPGPFAFGDRARVEDILIRAGWSNIAFERYDFGLIVGGGDDAVEDTVRYFATIGPAARALREMDDSARNCFSDKLRELALSNLHEGIVSLPAATWIVSAHRG